MIINYRKLNILNVGGFMFKPGVNDYPDLTQTRLQKMATDFPKAKAYLDDGTLEVVGSTDFDDFNTAAAMPSDNRQAIVGMKDREALAMVKETGDRDLLTYWLGTVKSKNVETAIKDQIAAIDKAGEPERK